MRRRSQVALSEKGREILNAGANPGTSPAPRRVRPRPRSTTGQLLLRPQQLQHAAYGVLAATVQASGCRSVGVFPGKPGGAITARILGAGEQGTWQTGADGRRGGELDLWLVVM